jgi:hypothetical protein
VHHRMFNSGIVVHSMSEVVSSLTPRKYTVLNGNFVFNLHTGIKQNLVYIILYCIV